MAYAPTPYNLLRSYAASYQKQNTLRKKRRTRCATAYRMLCSYALLSYNMLLSRTKCCEANCSGTEIRYSGTEIRYSGTGARKQIF
eukprot:1491180-Rhodomonas_salina.2